MSDEIEKLSRDLAVLLIKGERRICTAESCTGGLIAKTFTDLAGSSEWFDRGFVTYSNQSKIDMLGVQSSTLLAHGAVSEAVAAEMAKGGLNHSEAHVAIAVTGIAGPSGGSEAKPVGTVWFGFALEQRVLTEKQCFAGDRTNVREESLAYALRRTYDLLA